MVTCNKDKTGGGGVEIFYSNRTKLVKIVKSTVKLVQLLSTNLQSGPEVLMVTVVYKSPNYPKDEFLAKLGDHMIKLESKEDTKHVICGDYNISVFLEDQKVSKLIEILLSHFGFQSKKQQNG